MSQTDNKIQQLQEIFKVHQTILIVMQDNPDTGAIASAVALRLMGRPAI